MRTICKYIILIIGPLTAKAQFDPLTTPLVYQVPEMEKVVIQKGLTYKTINKDTSLSFDIYYPPNFDGKRNLSLVIFNNGVGSMQLPQWRIYKDWAKLMALNGMVAVTHQSRQGKTKNDFEDLLVHLRTKASDLSIDENNFGVWVCSANTPVGWPTANNPKNEFIRAVAVLYGVIQPEDRVVKRKDLEILLSRAGLDSQNINNAMEELMANALQNDAHVEFINYPEGQHAFDAVDNTPRSKEIILMIVDFFKRNLVQGNMEPKLTFITNRQLWRMILDEKKTDEAINQYKLAYDYYSKKPGSIIFFNQLLNENNLNTLGYQLLGSNRVEEALKLFETNAEHFPNSPNVFDALADAYEKSGDKSSAVKNAKLTLEKLAVATNLPAPFAKRIKESAEAKINRLTK